MPRQARVVTPGLPHHATQRGNRRRRTFFEGGDYLAWPTLAAEVFKATEVEGWAYCLMPNHIRLIAVTAGGAGQGGRGQEWLLRPTINMWERWTGYLWRGRFASFGDGRDPSADLRPLRRAKPGAGGVHEPAVRRALPTGLGRWRRRRARCRRTRRWGDREGRMVGEERVCGPASPGIFQIPRLSSEVTLSGNSKACPESDAGARCRMTSRPGLESKKNSIHQQIEALKHRLYS